MDVVTYYIRGDRDMSVARQMALITQHGRIDEPIWNEAAENESWQDAADYCDEGQAVGICGVDRMPGGLKTCLQALDELHAEGKSLYCIVRGHIIDPSSAAAIKQMWLRKRGLASMPSSEEAKRRGALAVQNSWRNLPRAERDALRKIYMAAPTLVQAAVDMGMSRSKLYRIISEGGLPDHPSMRQK